MTSNISYVGAISEIPFTKECLVIADKRLPQTILDSLPDPILVEPGEGLKSLASIERLAEQVLQRRSSKPLTLVAVGGGSIGDAVGFLASILWRGVGLWHVPTTLLAMIDSAHGGKTAVNLPNAKNQLGTFYSAGSVYVVTDILAELPLQVRREGLTELLKAFLLPGEEPFEHLPSFEELTFAPWDTVSDKMMQLIKSAINIKLSIVKQDPYEKTGVRSVLNLGHTLGHGLERTLGISHGTAVAWGLAAMLEVSRSHGLPDANADRAFAQLYPLLSPLPKNINRDAVLQAMHRDKKRKDQRLRSIVLEDFRRPKITEQVSEYDWLDAFDSVRKRFESGNVRVSAGEARGVTLTMSASKSQLNRALVIAALRPGKTVIRGTSDADDVHNLYSALRKMGFGIEQTADGYQSLRNRDPNIPEHTPAIHCGEGAAPFRFLLAVAASMQKETILLAEPQLLGRPHDNLLSALRDAGAAIEPYKSQEGMGYRVQGWEKPPKNFTIDVSLSSQYASAIALLAAGADAPFTMRLDRNPVSAPYLDMTLSMLKEAGVEIIYEGYIIACNPTAANAEKLEFSIEPDASSAAVWHAARHLGHPLELRGNAAGDSLQPDAQIQSYLDAIDNADTSAEIDLTDAPDLLPVLTVAALRKGTPVHFIGIERLAHKESNRIDGFAESLRAIGIPMERTEGGLRTPAFADVQFKPDAVFHTHGDHRLVMAGALLAMLLGPVQMDSPWSVTKSYPAFWDHARMAGWDVQSISDSFGTLRAAQDRH